MNLFKKALIAVLGLGLVVAPSANRQVEEVEAAKISKWGISGTFNGWVEDPMTYNEETKRYEYLLFGATTTTEFKIRPDGGWLGWNGNTGNTANGKGTYLTGSDNYKFKVAGDFIIFVYDNSSASYTPWAADVGVEKYVPAKEFTVTYHTDKVVTETYKDKQTWNSKFIEKEGYRLEGWYTDSALSKEFKKGSTITSDLDLYPKYVEAKDYKVYFDDNGTLGTTVYAYTFRNALDGAYEVAWPGTKMTKESNGLWSYTMDASLSDSVIIFNGGNNKPQTVNLDLTYETSLYTIGAKDTEGHYKATVTEYNHLNGYYQTNGENSIRFIGVFGVAGSSHFAISDYASVGFKVVSGENEKTVDSGYVYTSVVANGETISAATYNAQYFFVLTFNNVPADTEITVTPFAKLANGTVYYGTAVSYAF